MKKLLVFASLISLLPLTSNATYVQTYSQGKTPFDLKQDANPYKRNNPYNTNNNNNPYSKFRSVYNKDSVNNNYGAYSAKTRTFNTKFQGHISSQVTDPKSINNPYGKYGNQYRKDRAANPYTKDSSSNIYSKFRRPYNKHSVNNSNRYSAKIFDSRGNFRGVLNPNNHINNQQSYRNPYSKYGNPYSPYSVSNPYGQR